MVDRGVVFSPDGHFVASVTDCFVHLWKVSTWTKDFTFKHLYVVGAVAFSPQGHQLASCSYDGTITIWDLITRVASSVFERNGLFGLFVPLPQLEFSPDGRHLACYFDGNVRVWDVGNKTISIERSLEHISNVSYLEFSPDGCYLAVTFRWGIVGMLDLSIGTRQTVLAGHESSVDCVAFSPNGSQLVSVSLNSVYIWNTKTWTRDKIHGLDSLRRAEFSDDGRLILIHKYNWGNHCIGASTLKKVRQPGSSVPADVTTFPAPRLPVFISNDRRSLCLQKGNQTIHFCWFPDSFQASSIAKYKDLVCIGGEHGEILSIDLGGFEVPDI